MSQKELPFVSICTPTFNRRPFIPALIKCVSQQTYPMHLIEWVITDDGTDPIEDLIVNVPIVKYFRYNEKMSLGKKRNITHQHCSGSIIIYMDDDDYYPPTRVEHAVHTLLVNPSFAIAGCVQLPIYYQSKSAIYMAGPYGPNRITAATFAFRRELLGITRFDDTVSVAEESVFLQNYTIPVVSLDPVKTILVFAHNYNTIDKENLLEQTSDLSDNPYIYPSTLTVYDFITDNELYSFYIVDMMDLLNNYEPGSLSHKPDVLIHIKDIQIKRLQAMLGKMNRENDRLHKLNAKLKEVYLQSITPDIHR